MFGVTSVLLIPPYFAVECVCDEATILRLMLNPSENKEIMRSFLQDVSDNCRAALLDCTPVNSDHVSSFGTLQVYASEPSVFLVAS